MGIAALVIGIVSMVFSFIPCLGQFAVFPAIVGIVLGLVDMSKKRKAKQPTSISTAGFVCSLVAAVLAIFLSFCYGKAAEEAGKKMDKAMESSLKDMERHLNSLGE